MPYKRGLYIEKQRRLLSKRAQEESWDTFKWGHTCDCCGFSCVLEELRNPPFGSGIWRFKIKDSIKHKFDSRYGKFQWLLKRFPKMVDRLSDDYLKRTPQYQIDSANWSSDDHRVGGWQKVVERHTYFHR